MIDLAEMPMSGIVKEMALTTLIGPESVPSSEAAGAALLLSHVAWQRANGDHITLKMYRLILAEMQRVKPDFWKELKAADPEKLIAALVIYKSQNYPSDKRKVVACGTYDNKVRAEWTD